MVRTWNRKTSLERLTWYKYLHRHGLFMEWFYENNKGEIRFM